MDDRLKKEINDTLTALDISRDERPEMAQVIEELAEYFYNLGRRAINKNERL